MSGTHEGAMVTVARKAGVSLSEYKRLRLLGDKWCMRCKRWHPEKEFGQDKSRYDGLDPSCKESRKSRQRELYQPVSPELRKAHGPARLPSRDGDKKQARHFVNLSVQSGRLPKPNNIPCFDCGHLGPDRQHEYDHYLGYSPEHHESVQSVCDRCHVKREIKRGRFEGRRRDPVTQRFLTKGVSA
jgi:hypothetical protein